MQNIPDTVYETEIKTGSHDTKVKTYITTNY